MASLLCLSHEFFIWWKWPANRAKVIELLLSKFNDSRVNCIHCHISYIYIYIYYLKPLAFWNEFHIDICIHLIVQNFIFFISYILINCEYRYVASFHLMYVLESYMYKLTFIMKHFFSYSRRFRKARGNAGKVPGFPEKSRYVLCLSLHSEIYSEWPFSEILGKICNSCMCALI